MKQILILAVFAFTTSLAVPYAHATNVCGKLEKEKGWGNTSNDGYVSYYLISTGNLSGYSYALKSADASVANMIGSCRTGGICVEGRLDADARRSYGDNARLIDGIVWDVSRVSCN